MGTYNRDAAPEDQSPLTTAGTRKTKSGKACSTQEWKEEEEEEEEGTNELLLKEWTVNSKAPTAAAKRSARERW